MGATSSCIQHSRVLTFSAIIIRAEASRALVKSVQWSVVCRGKEVDPQWIIKSTQQMNDYHPGSDFTSGRNLMQTFANVLGNLHPVPSKSMKHKFLPSKTSDLLRCVWRAVWLNSPPQQIFVDYTYWNLILTSKLNKKQTFHTFTRFRLTHESHTKNSRCAISFNFFVLSQQQSRIFKKHYNQ